MFAVLRQRSAKHIIKTIIRLRNTVSKPNELNEYYFGYGANLNTDRFKVNHMHAQ